MGLEILAKQEACYEVLHGVSNLDGVFAAT
jgi:hypothetical protein